MRTLRYSAETDALVIDGNPVSAKLRLHDCEFAPVARVAEASLVSFRDAARSVPDGTLELRFARESPETFDARWRSLSSELVWLSSDGSDVWIDIKLMLYSVDDLPHDEEDFRTLIESAIAPMLVQFDAELVSADIGRYVPEGRRDIQMKLRISPQRRSVGDARTFGKAIRDVVQFAPRSILNSLDGSVQMLMMNPALLVGRPESAWLEAKRQPYKLEEDSQKFELAKDVAALANSGGGLIVIGFSTRRESGGDVISAVRTFELARLSVSRYRQVVRARVHPMPERLEIGLIETSAPVGVGYIAVPSQPPEMRPFMLREASSSGKIRTSSVAIPVRIGAEVEYESTSPEALHSLIVAGRLALREIEASDHKAPTGRARRRSRD